MGYTIKAVYGSLAFTASANGIVYQCNGNAYGIYNAIVYAIYIAIVYSMYIATGTCCECETHYAHTTHLYVYIYIHRCISRRLYMT